MLDFRIIKIGIGRSFADAYSFLADARNFAAWGGPDPQTAMVDLGSNRWQFQIDGTPMVVRYSEPNAYGILDYEGGPRESGPPTPCRLYPNGEGCELILTHFHREGISGERYASAAEWIESDLLRLKTFLEKDHPPRPMFESRIISLPIGRPVADAYRFFIEPRNFAKWASLTNTRFEHRGGRDWLADTAAGPRVIRFIEPNPYGVLDHAVFAEGETPAFGPMRVVANGEGTLLTYTFFRRPEFSDEKFESTVEWITSDLMTAKTLLEV